MRGGEIVEFTPLAVRLRRVAAVLGVTVVLGSLIDGLVRGLSFGLMGLWVGIFVVGMVIAAAVSVAVHALSGADTAQRRGERLSGDDVGLLPPRRGNGEI